MIIPGNKLENFVQAFQYMKFSLLHVSIMQNSIKNRGTLKNIIVFVSLFSIFSYSQV